MNKIVLLLLSAFFIGHTYAQEKFYQNDKYGVKDASGKVVLKAKYDYIYDFENGYADIMLKDKHGIVDKNGKVIVEPKYESKLEYNSGYFNFSVKEKYGLLNEQGKEVLPAIYTYPIRFDEETGLAKIATVNPNSGIWGNSGYGLMDRSLNVVLEPKYSTLKILPSGYVSVSHGAVGAVYGLLDRSYKEVIPVKYEAAGVLGLEILTAMKDGKWLLFDNTGQLLNSLQYDEVTTFGTIVDFARVKRNGKYGYINRKGQEVIPPKYDEAGIFRNGSATVKLNGQEYTLDKSSVNNTPAAISSAATTKVTSAASPGRTDRFSSMQAFVDYLNKESNTSRIGFDKPSYNFLHTGSVYTSESSLKFIIKNGEIYIQMIIPQKGECDYGMKTIKAEYRGTKGTYSPNPLVTLYYLAFPYTYECGDNKYETIYVYFNIPFDQRDIYKEIEPYLKKYFP